MQGSIKRLYSGKGGEVFFSRRSTAVEWSIPVGGRSLYGLLGVAFMPLQRELQIETIDEVPHRKYSDSLMLGTSDNILVGLSTEYRTSVVYGILTELEENGEGISGRILTSSAVIGEQSSCRKILENIGRVVTALLRTTGNLSEPELRSIVVFR